MSGKRAPEMPGFIAEMERSGHADLPDNPPYRTGFAALQTVAATDTREKIATDTAGSLREGAQAGKPCLPQA
ncbi:hypothetical protein [Rhodobacter sp. CZR27]|uniref:hypothetical protein n=1 Tax=Rhodobacter sp. CZR27 TaxID=2033869 RepID=UPI0018E0C2C2|nr:hypothetical protein [Rhodobacter sp. CZR27]